MKQDFSPLVSLIKDLQNALKAYQKSLKDGNEEAIIAEKQIHFLKISKSLLSLFKSQPENSQVKTLKNQADAIIKVYKSLCQSDPEPDATSVNILHSLEEDKEVYNSPQELNSQILRQRREEIDRLHKDMLDLHDLFQGISHLVDQQGILLEKVEGEVEVAEKTTERTNNDLREARALQRQSQKKYCWIIFIVLTTLGVVGGVLAAVILSR